MSTETRMYYVECESLSPEEFREVYELLTKWAFFHTDYLDRPQCFKIVWSESKSPNELFPLPEGCHLYQL